MSKVQVDTIVDKDDISAPSLTKGAIVTGVCTATSFDGAISEWVLGADGTSHYTFTGSGLTGAENDPTLYLKRGQKYRFKNSSGGHPFRIQSTANGSAGTAYNDGVTNNDAGDGTTLEWDVQFDAPSVLYYQCTAHGNMGGKIYIGNSGNSSTLVDLNVSGVTTTGIATVTTSVVVGSAVTANADGVITSGIITATSFAGDGSSLTGIDATQIVTGNTSVQTADTGSDGHIKINTEGTERLRIIADGKVGIGTTIPTRSFDVRGDATIGIDQHSGNPGTTVGILTVRGHHVNSDSEYAQLYLANSNSSGGSTASIRGNRETSNNATSLSFFTNHTSSAGNGDERLRIGTNGQLGLSAGGVGVAATDFGTSGQVLTSGGASATATWADAGGGAWELIQNTDLGSDYGSDTFTYTGFTTAYSEYRVNVNQVGYVGGSAKKLYCRVYLNETYHDASVGYYSKYAYTDYTTGGQSTGGALETSWWRFQGDSSNNYWQGQINIPQQPDIANFAKSSKMKAEWLSGSYYIPFDVVNLVNVTGGSTLKQITGIRLGNGTDSTNFAFGRIQIYGLKTS